MRTPFLATAFAGVMLCTLAARSQQQVSPAEARKIVRDAYVYAYPLLLHELGMRQTTNYAEPTGIPGQGPFNQFAHGRAFPPADFKIIVRANVDTLLFSCQSRSRPGATCTFSSGDRPLFHAAHDRHVERCFRRTGQADQWHERGKLRSGAFRLDRDAA